MEHPRRMIMWISSYCYSYTKEEDICFHTHFGYIRPHVLLLDEPQMPLITIEANASYDYPFEHTSL